MLVCFLYVSSTEITTSTELLTTTTPAESTTAETVTTTATTGTFYCKLFLKGCTFASVLFLSLLEWTVGSSA